MAIGVECEGQGGTGGLLRSAHVGNLPVKKESAILIDSPYPELQKGILGPDS